MPRLWRPSRRPCWNFDGVIPGDWDTYFIPTLSVGQSWYVNLPALLAQVLKELETSTDPDRVALIRRLRDGTYTPRDTSDIADMIESVVERAVKAGRHN